ncbi:exocyst complex component 4 [Cryptococcus neoformans Th84]|nr:exocyst complex component 4 [Cryptococcus neoformans var. grubii Th84]
MSRQPPAKYKISGPQPVRPDLRTAYSTDNGPYPAFVQESPPRPARSRMRDAPRPPQPPRPALVPPLHTRRPSGDALEIPPASPADVFAADRAQRMQMRAQMSAAAHQASRPLQLPGAANTETMRNVVGAFMSAGRQHEQPPPARRPHKSEARMRKPHREEVWQDEKGGQFGEIDSAMRQVKKDWPFVMESNFSSSSLALSLLSQTPSPSLPQHPGLAPFLRLHESLSAGLQAAVQAHSKSFAASLPAHQNFLDILARAQEQVRKSKQELKAARDGFAGKGKSELSGIRARERTVRDMLRILDTIDNLKQVPDQLESLIGDKRFLQASLILVRSLETINKPELREIGALSDLRSYFVTQETTITEILIEELHNHIYLKTFYSDPRWRPYTPGRADLPIIESQGGDDLAFLRSPDPNSASPNLNTSTTTTTNGNAAAGPGPSSKFSRYLSQLSTKPSTRPMLQYDGDPIPSTLTLSTVSHQQQNANALSPGTGMPQADSHTSLSSLLGTAGNTGNPETDSYVYIENLLEALAVLGRLGQALDTVAQRAPGEIYALVDGTLDEVEERTERRREEDLSVSPQNVLGNTIDPIPSSSRTIPLASTTTINTTAATTAATTVSSRKSLFSSTETSQIEISLGAAGPPQHAALLKDLFWTLYSKLAAVLEGHRVMYEVSRWVSSRPGFKDSTTPKGSSINIPVLEMWRPVQQEVRTLLSNYLTDDQPGSRLDRNPILSINEVLRDPKVSRDKSKPMFKFNDSDSRAIQKEIKPIDDSVQQALRSSVPGLVNMQSDQPVSVVAPDTDDRFSPSSGRYRTLVPPNAFNVTTLFQPTLAFIHRASAIVPPGFESETQGFSTILEDFVVKVFLTQLDEKVTAGFQKAVSGYDAYQVDRGALTDMKQPPLKSSVRVMALIHSLCIMLQTTPFHRENYSRLIVGVIVQYYQQCSARFKDLVSHPATFETDSERPMVLPAVWAQREDITKCLSEMRSVPRTDRGGMVSVSHKEIRLEMELLRDRPVSEPNLIHSSRKLEALGNLSQSLRWFIDALLDLQMVSEEPASPEGEQPELDVLKTAPPLSPDSDEPRLPLTRAMAQRYQAIIQTYEQLAEMVVNAIRLEIRCRVMCNIGASMQKGDFRLESEALEPDSDILDLNTSLIEFEELAQRTISPDDHSFIFRALGQLVDHCLIAYASKYVNGVNAAGVRKIKRNILSLQQTLRGIAAASEQGVLTRASEFWDLYEQGPKKMLEDLKNINGTPPYAFEDYNTMLKLQCKSNTDELNTYLIDLHALSMDVEGWDLGED